MIEASWIAFAFALGLLARFIGLPPLIGYLGAGFALAAAGDYVGVTRDDSIVLDHLSHLGVLLLLFTVGLKLKLGNLVRREVIGGSLLHFFISSVLVMPAIMLILDNSWREAMLLAIALSFSSTVLAAKVLESKRELRAFHGRVAIGVLIIQDLIALVVMSLAAGKAPSAWALLVFLLPLLRPVLFRLLDHSGHEELMVLLGLMLALVAGGLGFEYVGLSSELGALAFGAMLAKHKRASELSNSLWAIKEVFLVGFFLKIGIGGLPDADAGSGQQKDRRVYRRSHERRRAATSGGSGRLGGEGGIEPQLDAGALPARRLGLDHAPLGGLGQGGDHAGQGGAGLVQLPGGQLGDKFLLQGPHTGLHGAVAGGLAGAAAHALLGGFRVRHDVD